MMTLLGWPLLVLLVVLAVAAPAGCLLAWGRLRGPRAVRLLGRLGLIAVCQTTALLLVGVVINRNLQLYASWDDLLGTGARDGEIQAMGPPDRGPHDGGSVGGGRQGTGPFRMDRRTRTYRAIVKGPKSGVTGEIRVWLPKEYADPAHAHRRFPVVELFPGFPGTPSTWFIGMRGGDQLAEAVKRGRGRPAVLVAPMMTVQPGRDTECSDIPKGPKVATWLTDDVREIVARHFRVRTDGPAWAAMGYSTGGFCAAKLATQHPGRYRAAVSMAGYFRPTAPDLLRDPKTERANSPLTLVGRHPAVELLLAGSREDPGTVAAIQELLPKVKQPTRAFTYIVPTGGHNIQVWQRMLPKAYSWLAERLPAPS
ncbi:alpha/beta hydrolase-fold protein [Actinomadura kijaniata]|uniref:Enterochelin esterase-like enzyme n=1 Tax=Actinomadura namibiensis TaxID=182080 RepID=A0A7W3LNS2_ACTNM|nr:alpha/beta hydrolase-fold protein [Actinomadura namibiensis]MBA8951487.1 enterochelin esterase-like enzyme [Actinomadura namibiensis]